LARRFRRRDADHDLISSSESSVDHRARGLAGRWTPSETHTPPRQTEMNEEMDMDSQLIEWGPAHLRDEATVLDFEPQDPPDDN
jgi:hypothetical protein